MHDVVVTALVASGAFFGTTIDNVAAFAAQLALTEKSRYNRVCGAKFAGLLVIVAITTVVAVVLGALPVRWVSVLAVIPVAIAWHAWRHRRDPQRVSRRGPTTTFLATIAVGGDNLAVWIPLFRALGASQLALTIAVFVFWDLIEILVTRVFASHPAVVTFGQRWAPSLTPLLYLALAGVIIWRCWW